MKETRKMGKLSAENLKQLLSYIKKDSRVIVPPLAGFDSGVHLMGNRYVVVSTDPCIGVPEEWFGWLLIHYAASDVALFGAKPEYCTIILMGPPSTDPCIFNKVMKQAGQAADELEMAIVTGHTGTYKGLSTLVGVCTAYGEVSKEKLITPGGAEPKDLILCIKPIGMETAVNFSLTHKRAAEGLFGAEMAKKMTDYVAEQSCVKEALLLAEIDGVHAMHDTTEGGLVAALNEMASASNVGFRIEFEKILILEEALKLQKCFQLSDKQVLALSSTGTILASVDPKVKEEVRAVLSEKGVKAGFIGSFTKNMKTVLIKEGTESSFPKDAIDPYEKIMGTA